MLKIKNFQYYIGERYLFKDSSFSINQGERIALIGANGTGKSTLFKIIAGKKDFDYPIESKKNIKIGYLPQEYNDESNCSLLQTALKGREDLNNLENKLKELNSLLNKNPQDEKILKEVEKIEQLYWASGGYDIQAQATIILKGLGFKKEELNKPLMQFSGGWRMRALLASLLLQNNDLLLLDEPSNHLDIPAMEWLEQFLLNCQSSIVIISHDKYFLKKICNVYYEINNCQLFRYKGNYDKYIIEKNNKKIIEEKRLKKIKAENEKILNFAQKFRAQATKASQVQSRLKQLKSEEPLYLEEQNSPFNLQITPSCTSYKDVLKIDNLTFRYPNSDKDVFNNLNFQIERGDKVALIGSNGAGKTTLTKLICQELLSKEDNIVLGKNVEISYFAQHHAESLDHKRTLYENISDSAPMDKQSEIRDLLGMMRFKANQINTKVQDLSGGEKTRAALCKILLSKGNFLIMDEPTNHLDTASIETLEKALKNYTGTLIIISHDRSFLNNIVNKILAFDENGELIEYKGNYSQYAEWRKKTKDNKAVHGLKDTKNQNKITSKKEEKRIEAQKRQAISKERNNIQDKINDYENKINILEKEKEELEKNLMDSTTYQDSQKIIETQKRYHLIQEELDILMQKWEEEQENLEELLNRIK